MIYINNLKMNQSNNPVIQDPPIKFNSYENFLPLKAIDTNIKSNTFKERNIDEHESDIYYRTLHGGQGELVLNRKGKEFIYIGYIKHGLLHCTDPEEKQNLHIQFPNGTIYQGDVKENELTGVGNYIFPNKNEYFGDIVNGLRHGKGIFQSADIDNYDDPSNFVFYKGDWKKGLKDGKGKMILEKFDYNGDWVKGQKHGMGVCTWYKYGRKERKAMEMQKLNTENNSYEGEFKNNKICGNGFMIWYSDTNEKYIGQWENNKREGVGIQIWYDIKGDNKYLKTRYVGEWLDNKRNGYGVFFYSNGSKYEGTWRNDLKCGIGLYTDTDGVETVYYYENDKIKNKATMCKIF